MAKHSEKQSLSVNTCYNRVTDKRSVEVFHSLLCLPACLTLFPAPALFWFLFSFLWIPFPLVHLLVGDCFCKPSALMECLEEWLALCVLKDSKGGQPNQQEDGCARQWSCACCQRKGSVEPAQPGIYSGKGRFSSPSSMLFCFLRQDLT